MKNNVKSGSMHELVVVKHWVDKELTFLGRQLVPSVGGAEFQLKVAPMVCRDVNLVI